MGRFTVLGNSHFQPERVVEGYYKYYFFHFYDVANKVRVTVHSHCRVKLLEEKKKKKVCVCVYYFIVLDVQIWKVPNMVVGPIKG